MADLKFKRIVKANSNYLRARAVYLGKTVSDNFLGHLYLNYNELHKNKELYVRLNNGQIDQADRFVQEYNKERRLVEDFSNEKYNLSSFYISDTTALMLEELEQMKKIKPISSLISEAIHKELLNITEKDNGARSVCDKYGYDYLQLMAFKKKKNVFSADYEQIKKVIDLLLSLEDDTQNIINNLNDHLITRFNTEKQFTLAHLEKILDPENTFVAKAYLIGAMIDVIHNYGVNPVLELDMGVVFFYWYQIRLLHYPEPKALKKFIKEFELEDNSLVDSFIDSVNKPLVELMTREITDKYVGLNK
jgi:hypothetical protein